MSRSLEIRAHSNSTVKSRWSFLSPDSWGLSTSSTHLPRQKQSSAKNVIWQKPWKTNYNQFSFKPEMRFFQSIFSCKFFCSFSANRVFAAGRRKMAAGAETDTETGKSILVEAFRATWNGASTTLFDCWWHCNTAERQCLATLLCYTAVQHCNFKEVRNLAKQATKHCGPVLDLR